MYGPRPRDADRPARPDDRRDPVSRKRGRRAPARRPAQGRRHRRCRLPRAADGDARGHGAPCSRAGPGRRARRARADDRDRAQGRTPAPAGRARRAYRERGQRAQPLRRRSRRVTLEEWLRAVVATPGLTAIRDLEEARRVLLEDSLRGLELVQRYPGTVIDVGSGGGAPGIPLAFSLSEREVTLLEANGRKCEFLRRIAPPNATVVQGRAEEQQPDRFGVAVAKALAPPPTAAEWLLPLVAPGGAAVLWTGPSADPDRVARVAERLGGESVDSPPGFLVLEKRTLTPPGFPRRVGVARRRPLA